MFKFTLYITLCIALIYVSIFNPQNPRLETLATNHSGAIHSFFSRDDISSPLITNRLQTGLGFIYLTSTQNAPLLRNKLSNIDGESISVPLNSTNLSKQSILRSMNYQKISQQTIGNIVITNAYSNRAKDFITTHDTSGRQIRINLQIAITATHIVVGWPVILGSF